MLDDILEPVTNAFSHDVAEALVNIKAGEVTQSAWPIWPTKCNEGLLTPMEKAEYESYVTPRWDMVSVLQAKARIWLARHRTF